jgi:hypothetical protein
MTMTHETLGAEIDAILRRQWTSVDANVLDDDEVRLRAIVFTLIGQVFGHHGRFFIKALKRFNKKAIPPEHWAAEYEQMLWEQEAWRWEDDDPDPWAWEANETIDAYTEERHEEFERLVAAKGRPAAIKEFCERLGAAI